MGSRGTHELGGEDGQNTLSRVYPVAQTQNHGKRDVVNIRFKV